MNYFRLVKYNDNVMQFCDPLGVLATLVVGEEKALLFDTCYGIGNLYEEVKAVCDKELIVVNSHGHMDHSCGNYQFKEVYINKKALELCKRHNGYETRLKNIERARKANLISNSFDTDSYLKQNEGNLKFIKYGHIFDLGGITLEVIDMVGHTLGSIGLYSKELKLLLASDASCPFVWLFLPESQSVSTYIKMLEKTLKLDFDSFLVGHGARLLPKYRMQEFLDVAKGIDMEKAVKVHFDGFEDTNPYCYTLGKMYDQDGCGVVFDPDKLY